MYLKPVIYMLSSFILAQGFGQSDTSNRLEESRKDYLFNSDLSMAQLEYFKDSINVGKKADPLINVKLSSDRTKFIAFKRCSPNSIGFDGSPIRQMDTIDIMGVNINSCTYMLSGVLHDSNWYYKEHSQVFKNASAKDENDAILNSLVDMHFFKLASSDLNESFWEDNMFIKIEIDTTDILKEKNALKGKIQKIKSEYSNKKWKLEYRYKHLLKYEKYNGLHKIVADSMLSKEKHDNFQFESIMSEDYFLSFLKTFINCNDNYVSFKTHTSKNLGLIYPENKSFAICPVRLTDTNENMEIHFFVALKDENTNYKIYKWTYFSSVKPEHENMFGGTTVELISSISLWNYSYTYLYSDSFLATYISKVENGKFKYLLETCTSANKP